MEQSRILIIDDDARLSHLVQIVLDGTGNYRTAIENRPLYAVAAARAFQPDLVLLDVDMPGRDGGDIACEMENDPALKDVAILFFTALVSQHEAEMRKRDGKNVRFLSKTTNPKLLCPAIDEALAAAAR